VLTCCGQTKVMTGTTELEKMICPISVSASNTKGYLYTPRDRTSPVPEISLCYLSSISPVSQLYQQQSCPCA
jgi:uncharacterized protein YcgL (UPF0745 family)